MVNVLLFFLFALFWEQPAEAQTFPKPPDVPAYVEVLPTYAAGTTLNVVGNGSATAGTPPAYSTELAETNPVPGNDWTVATSNNCLTTISGGTCTEAKFRFTMSGEVSIKYDDPVRNYGQPGTSHCHEFFNNLATNAYSTRASLRATATRYLIGAGGPRNATGYWFPCLVKTNPFADGKNYAVKPTGLIIGYYSIDPSISIKTKRPAFGTRYVLGMNMDDPDQNWLRARIAIANAQPGTSGRYSLCDPSTAGDTNTGNGCGYSMVWKCSTAAGELSSRWLKNSDNTDPFSGNCTTGKDLWMQVAGPTCWDGRNPWSPGGYKHVIPGIWDSVAGSYTCPNGWYTIPDLQLQIHFAHTGFSDYGAWRLDSDDMAGTNAGRTMRNGESFHTDWMEAWDQVTFTTWHNYCIGVEGNTPHECDGSGINATRQLVSDTVSPTGRLPQVQNGTGVTTSASGMFLLPSTSNGPKDIHIHGS